MEIKGTITRIYDIQKGVSKNGKEWVKRDFVIDTGEKYNSTLCFTLFGEDKVEQLTQEAGDNVVVKFNLSSREYNDKWYTQAMAYLVGDHYPAKKEMTDEVDLPF
ncbi:MAG: hypothetical protein Unbinned92contig1003_37 [Prokaryotic dsDNA virus sp.]|nr:MAG: hypothetical protein Unbinned92contig1003_37 [Prokaryotic dsDNA virus sp.]